MSQRENILSQIKQAVKEVDPSADVILFGSQARGDVHEESDWDVMIITGKEVDKELKQKFRRRILDIQIREGVSIDALVRDRNYWLQHPTIPLYREIRNEGISF